MDHLCKNCGKVIIPATDRKGKDVNLDASKPCYLRAGVDEDGLHVELEPDAFVDHDSICENRNVSLKESFGE